MVSTYFNGVSRFQKILADFKWFQVKFYFQGFLWISMTSRDVKNVVGFAMISTDFRKFKGFYGISKFSNDLGPFPEDIEDFKEILGNFECIKWIYRCLFRKYYFCKIISHLKYALPLYFYYFLHLCLQYFCIIYFRADYYRDGILKEGNTVQKWFSITK